MLMVMVDRSVIRWYQEARKYNQVLFKYYIFLRCNLSTFSPSFLIYILVRNNFAQLSLNHFFLLVTQTAVPVFIGTKFDEFIQLPIALQWTIASQVNNYVLKYLTYVYSTNLKWNIWWVYFFCETTQARGYAKALNAPLFFSSAKYNINVNKIFKFITAKLFNLNWELERNLTIGEPIIDF